MTTVTVSGVLSYVVLSPVSGTVTIASPGPQGPPGPQGGGVYTWSGSAWVLDSDAKVYVQLTGDPDPTGLGLHDLVYRKV